MVALIVALNVFIGVPEAACDNGSPVTKKDSGPSMPVKEASTPAEAQAPSGATKNETTAKKDSGPSTPVKDASTPARAQAPSGATKNETTAKEGSGTGQSSPEKPPGSYDKAAKVLFVAFTIALFLESALAAIFNWRPFVQTFVRGTRTVVAFAVSLLLVLIEPRLDVFSKLVGAMFEPPQDPDLGLVGTVLSALMFAGGSSGINTLLVALGFRSMRTPESVVARPKPTEAWISVRLGQKPEVPARVMMKTDTVANATEQVIGIIDGSSPRFAWLRYFVRDKGRFPTSGGFPVLGGLSYTFTVETVRNGKATVLGPWGPFPIAAGAIIDIGFD
ncbi:hypothetical protein [Dechloromonas denitrificans]|uniref:hypothetical protein n=1 Tax=Dechloromonas denitrificans TaxID=281362 RepID=UPI001CF80C9A|nr:hypothetical protein [Dechloromonas denitrificans]UCV05676.1 hypothetical protein KI611_10665 [Dechloromonas denitrificans]